MSGAGSLRFGAGFTLVELLVALLVIGVLTAIAVPGYRTHVLRTQRTDATAALTRTQAAQERYFLEFNRYAGSLTDAPPAGLGLRATSDFGYYGLSLVAAEDGGGFTVTASRQRAVDARDDPRCSSLSIDESGLRGARDVQGGDTSEECWR